MGPTFTAQVHNSGQIRSQSDKIKHVIQRLQALANAANLFSPSSRSGVKDVQRVGGPPSPQPPDAIKFPFLETALPKALAPGIPREQCCTNKAQIIQGVLQVLLKMGSRNNDASRDGQDMATTYILIGGTFTSVPAHLPTAGIWVPLTQRTLMGLKKSQRDNSRYSSLWLSEGVAPNFESLRTDPDGGEKDALLTRRDWYLGRLGKKFPEGISIHLWSKTHPALDVMKRRRANLEFWHFDSEFYQLASHEMIKEVLVGDAVLWRRSGHFDALLRRVTGVAWGGNRDGGCKRERKCGAHYGDK
ncbi:hypothetical protein B0H11DRAFT_1928053 [Mycena galericulata]|nr:hypothetical protein B0H11DRAFT_1928053 [Mycena galericulata]